MASMERELLEVFEAARKAADAAGKGGGQAAVDRCVEALLQLKEIPVTMKVLVDTQIGKHLKSHLRKHPVKKIQTVASDLLELWKEVVLKETSHNNKNNGYDKTPAKIDVKPGRTETDKVVVENGQNARKMDLDIVSRSESFKAERRDNGDTIKVEKTFKAETVKVERARSGGSIGVRSTSCEETVKVEKITKEEKQTSGTTVAPLNPPKLSSMVKCNDAIRDKARELFAEALNKVTGEASEDIRVQVEASDPIRVAVILESVLFEKIGRSNGAHKQKYRSILFNLKDQNNPDLRRRVLLGEIQPEVLINMSAEDMASDERKRKNKEIKDKAMFECERAGAPKATTDQFKCGRCGQRKTTYHQMQTRSADEPMTTFVTCVVCNNNWKFC